MTQTHNQVEIRIFPETETGYPVELTINQDQQYSGGYLPANILEQFDGISDKERGQQLFNFLFNHPKTMKAWAEIAGQSPQRQIRLRIDEQAPELQTLPWELLYDTHLLAADSRTPFSRYLAMAHRPLPTLTKRPSKMLAVIANPDGLDDYNLAPIDVKREKENLQRALDGVKHIELKFLDELIAEDDLTTLSALGRALKQGYQLLHIIAHGVYNNRKRSGALLLADEYNEVSRVSDEKFAKMLQRQGDNLPHLLFLASCESATQSPDEVLRGLAPQLVKAGIPAVVAMQGRINIKTTQTFSRIFYQCLLDHGQLDLAINEARAELLTAELPDASLPLLFSRLIDNRLFTLRLEKSTSGRRGLTGDLLEDIRTVLLDCDEVYSARQLWAVFNVNTLRHFRDRLPIVDNTTGQVNALITHLLDSYNINKENALVLFLQALQSRYDPISSLHHDLGALAQQLAEEKQK